MYSTTPLKEILHLCLNISNKEYILQHGVTSTVAILKAAGVSLLENKKMSHVHL